MDTIYTVDCTRLVPNPYHLVHLAAARGRALGRGAEPRVEPHGEPVALLALREIAEGAFTRDELPILLESRSGEALEFSANEDPSEDELRDGMANSGSIALASQQREALLTANVNNGA